MKPRAFITGVSGFVGPYLVRHLIRDGFEVFGIDRSGKDVDGCVVEKCDVTDAAAVARVVKKVSPTRIFHLAGQSSVARSWKEPELTWKVNVDGFRNVLDSVEAAGTSPKVLLVSSAEVYGIPHKLPILETHQLAPISPYGESKVEQERIALGQVKDGTHIVISRSFNHTGPGQPDDFVCSNFARQVAGIEKGRHPPVIKVGDLGIRRDFSDVRDVVNAYLSLLGKGKPGEAYNVCSGRSFSLKDVVGLLAGLSTVRFSVKEEKAIASANSIPALKGDNSKIAGAVGWRPVIGFEQTLSDLLDYWRKNVS